MKLFPTLSTKAASSNPTSVASRAQTPVGMAGQPYRTRWSVERAVRDGYDRVIWVNRCVDSIASNQARLPIELRKDASGHGSGLLYGDQGSDTATYDDPVLALLNRRPNPNETAREFRYRLSEQLLLSKAGVFVEILRNRDKSIRELHLLPPERTAPVPDATTFISAYRVTMPNGGYVDMDPDDVIWVRKPHPTDVYSSQTPLESAGLSVDTDFYARLYNRNFLQNDGRPGGLIAVKGDLDTPEEEELTRRFNVGSGQNAGRTSVIEADNVSWVDTATTPRDMQWKDLRTLTKEEILLSFGVPESVLGNASGRTYDNADAEAEVFWHVTMLPHLELMAQPFDRLTGGGEDDDLYVVHDTQSVMVLSRPERIRMQEMREEIAAGLRTPNSYFEALGEKKIDDPLADTPWFPNQNKIALDKKARDELKKENPVPPPGSGPPKPGEPGAKPGAGGAASNDPNAGISRRMTMAEGNQPSPTARTLAAQTLKAIASQDLEVGAWVYVPGVEDQGLHEVKNVQCENGHVRVWVDGPVTKGYLATYPRDYAFKYSADQERDWHGRFGDGGGSASNGGSQATLTQFRPDVNEADTHIMQARHLMPMLLHHVTPSTLTWATSADHHLSQAQGRDTISARSNLATAQDNLRRVEPSDGQGQTLLADTQDRVTAARAAVEKVIAYDLELKEWDEGQHPRDEHGRFGDVSDATHEPMTVGGYPLVNTQPDAHAHQGKVDYMAAHGLGEPRPFDYTRIGRDESVSHRVADDFANLPKVDNSPECRAAYAAFAKETEQQRAYMEDVLGVKIVRQDTDPYPGVHDYFKMREDVRNGIMRVLNTSGHPYLSDHEYTTFRAVHDYFGHTASGRGFDRHSEEAAWVSHMDMYSKAAQPALTTETRGQNTYLTQAGKVGEYKQALLPPQDMVISASTIGTLAKAYNPFETYDPRERVCSVAGHVHPASELKYTPDQPRDDHGRFGEGTSPTALRLSLASSASTVPPAEPSARHAYADRILNQAAKGGLGPRFQRTEVQYEHNTQHPGRYTPGREAVHQEIVNGMIAQAQQDGVPRDHNAIIMGGLPGAGKSHALDDVTGGRPFLAISPDNMKMALAERGLIPQPDSLKPMESSHLVGDEAMKMSWDLANKATAQGYNVVWDVTADTKSWYDERIPALKQGGYRVSGAFVKVTPAESRANAEARYIKNIDTPMGGRPLPASYYAGVADKQYSSIHERAFVESQKQFNAWVAYDNSNHAGKVYDASTPAILDSGKLPVQTGVEQAMNQIARTT